MCYSLKSILNQAGYKCNLYTSPHLLSYTERYIFNDKEIDEENLIDLLEDTERILGDDNATLFEILTCAFIKHAENFKDNINFSLITKIGSSIFYKKLDKNKVYEILQNI